MRYPAAERRGLVRWTWLVPLLASAGCGRMHTYRIAAHKTPCFGEGPQLCMLIDKGAGQGLHYGGIEGFDFAWGIEVEANVRESRVANPPADGSSIRYTLVSVIEESPLAVGTTFVWAYDSFDVRPGWGDPWIDVDSGTLIDGTPFTCANAEACTAIQTSYEEGTEIEVTFAFGEGGALEVVGATL